MKPIFHIEMDGEVIQPWSETAVGAEGIREQVSRVRHEGDPKRGRVVQYKPCGTADAIPDEDCVHGVPGGTVGNCRGCDLDADVDRRSRNDAIHEDDESTEATDSPAAGYVHRRPDAHPTIETCPVERCRCARIRYADGTWAPCEDFGCPEHAPRRSDKAIPKTCDACGIEEPGHVAACPFFKERAARAAIVEECASALDAEWAAAANIVRTFSPYHPIAAHYAALRSETAPLDGLLDMMRTLAKNNADFASHSWSPAADARADTWKAAVEMVERWERESPQSQAASSAVGNPRKPRPGTRVETFGSPGTEATGQPSPAEPNASQAGADPLGELISAIGHAWAHAHHHPKDGWSVKKSALDRLRAALASHDAGHTKGG